MTAVAEKIKVKSIVIERWEGPSRLCGIKKTFDSWIDANVWLSGQSSTFPEGGGYDKHGFKVVFEDGETYEGRLDCKHFNDRNNDLDVKQHIRQHVKFYAGLADPYWMKKEDYDRIVETTGEKAEYAAFLEKYDI